jgi:hypothetical protein
MTEEKPKAPMHVSDGFTGLRYSMDKLKVLSHLCNSDVGGCIGNPLAISEVCRLVIDDALSCMDLGMKDLASEYSDLDYEPMEEEG